MFKDLRGRLDHSMLQGTAYTRSNLVNSNQHIAIQRHVSVWGQGEIVDFNSTINPKFDDGMRPLFDEASGPSELQLLISQFC